jgi:hypothetical protein
MAISLQTPASAIPVASPQAGPVIVGSAPSLASLEGQAQVLQEQLNQLLAQRAGHATRLRMMRGDERDVVAAQLKQVNAQIANTAGDLATVRAQIAMRQGKPMPQTSVPSDFQTPPGNRGNVDGQVTAVLIIFTLAVLMPIALGITRRLWRRTPKDSDGSLADRVSPRLEQLERAVDSIAIEIERISEGQRFVTKVLAERMPLAQPPALSDAPESSLRALGAGPIEPIRVAERQAVRQSVTPH